MTTKQSMYPKEYKIQAEWPFNAKYGSYDIGRPQVIYLNVKGKFTPREKKKTYGDDIRKIKQEFEDYVDDFFSKTKTFSNEFLHTCTISERNTMFGRKSNLKYEVMVKPFVRESLESCGDVMKDLSDTLSSRLKAIISENNFDLCE